MTRILVAALMLLWAVPDSAWGACTGSSPNWTSTADYASLSACVAGATAGDTIVVTGNATWASDQFLTVTRGVRLVGSGNPTITATSTYWIVKYVPDSTARANHETLTISGFVFDGSGATLRMVTGESTISGWVSMAVLNNVFRNGTSALYQWGGVYGVASGNTFTQIGQLFFNGGNDNEAWSALTQAPGVAQNFYFENNLINFTANKTGYTGWTETGQGGRIVVRHNTWDYTNITANDEFWDVHGLQTPEWSVCDGKLGNMSTMVAEYYGNALTNIALRYRWMNHRGGVLLQFFNVVSGGANPPNYLTVYTGTCNDQACMGSYDHQPTGYYFRNLVGSSEKAFSIDENGCATSLREENVNFWNYNASFTGTTGVGCGTLASRPATCTTGVGYWATNQSCSDLSGLVGRNPSTPISGTLYKCTATNTWTQYYTPYQYPHPLAGVITPNAPTNVRIR